MVKRTELEIKVAVLKDLKEECEAVWRDTKDDSIHNDPSMLRGAHQAFNWYVCISEMLDMYKDLLSEA